MLLKELKELYEEKKKDRDDSIANGVLSEFLNGEFTMLEKIIYRMENKRKPLSDGTLELTEKEKIEFIKVVWFDIHDDLKVDYVMIQEDEILMRYGDLDMFTLTTIQNYKAILYLAERFDLTEK